MTAPTFFVDRSLGKKVALALRSDGWLVEIHDDQFKQDALDVEWLPVVGAKGWTAPTADARMRSNDVEAATIREHAVRVVTLGSGNLTSGEMLERFRCHRRKIEEIAREAPRPSVWSVSKADVKMVRPPWARTRRSSSSR